jgi:large subunit ribosomal protein L21e
MRFFMGKRIGGLRRKSKHRLKKSVRRKGKVSVSRFMQSFKAGQKVHLSIEPSVHKGSYHTKFIGKTGVIKGARGRCYEVAVNDKGKEKVIIMHPIHLKSRSD